MSNLGQCMYFLVNLMCSYVILEELEFCRKLVYACSGSEFILFEIFEPLTVKRLEASKSNKYCVNGIEKHIP